MAGIGSATVRKLIHHAGSPEAVFAEHLSKLEKIPGIGRETLTKLRSRQSVLTDVEKEIEHAEKKNTRMLWYEDEEYPERLRQCSDGPLLLYARGKMNPNPARILSIVGTRKATERGLEHCDRIISELASGYPDLIIVSGLAYGIDVAAHRAALHQGLDTFAVLGHGLDHVYPAAHRATAEQISGQGALLSDFPMGELPIPKNFIKRNRIIAGLSDGTLVVESAKKGGAMVTADIANSYNRDVFTIPGRPGDEFSEGCNYLVKTNRAALVESAADIEYLLSWDIRSGRQQAVQQALFSTLGDEEKKIMEALREEQELQIDVLCHKTGLPIHQLSSLLLQLEFTGLVRALPGNRYRSLQS